MNVFLDWHDKVYGEQKEKTNNSQTKKKRFSPHWYKSGKR